MSADSDESLRRALAGERYWPTARYNSRLYHSSFPDSPFAGPASTDDHDIADDPDADDDPADEDEQEGPAMAPDLSMATTATLQDDDPDGGLITPAVSQSQTLPPVAPKEEVADEDDQHEDEDEAGPSTLISQSRDSPPSSTSPSPADPDPRQHTRATIPELLPVLPDGVDASRVWIDPFILRALCSHRVGRYTPRQNLEYMQQWLVGCGRDLGPMRRVWEGQIPTILLDRDERPGPLSPEYIGEVIVHLALHRVRMDEEDTTLAPVRTFYMSTPRLLLLSGVMTDPRCCRKTWRESIKSAQPLGGVTPPLCVSCRAIRHRTSASFLAAATQTITNFTSPVAFSRGMFVSDSSITPAVPMPAPISVRAVPRPHVQISCPARLCHQPLPLQ